MNLNIALCDDEKPETEYLKKLIVKWSDSRQIPVNISVFDSSESFLFHYSTDKCFDILLLDIQMRGLNGVALARLIRKENDAVQIIFVTGLPDYVSEGYDVSALHYLMKPVNESKLNEVLDRAYNRIDRKKKYLLVSSDGKDCRILFDDILYIESFRNSVSVVTTRGSYEVRQNISKIMEELDDSFFRCQRSFIVMLGHIKFISKTDVQMDDGRLISLSRHIYKDLYAAFISYFKGTKSQ